MHALILSYPQAIFDYYPYINKKFKLVNGQVSTVYEDHLDIIKRGIDNRMDIYKLGFMLTQIVALIFLASKVLIRNRLLQVRFLVRVKHRLMQINKLKDINMDVKFDEQEIQQLEALLNEQFEEETRTGSLQGS